MLCAELLLLIGVYTTHLYPNDLNENNNAFAVQCDNVFAGTMINSYYQPTNFIGWDFNHTEGDLQVGVIPTYIDGYDTDILPIRFGVMSYAQYKAVRVTMLGVDVINVGVAFKF